MSLANFFNVNLEHKDFMSWYQTKVMPFHSCNSSSEAKEKMLTSTRVMLIRHPFHRLASAFQFIFRYSIQETEAKYFEHQASVLLSRGIIEQLRPGSANPQITFSEFVEILGALAKSLGLLKVLSEVMMANGHLLQGILRTCPVVVELKEDGSPWLCQQVIRAF